MLTKRVQREREVAKYYDAVAEVCVCGGFPVIAVGRIKPAEYDVGIMSDYLEEVGIRSLAYGPVPFLEGRMTDLDWERVECALWDARKNA